MWWKVLKGASGAVYQLLFRRVLQSSVILTGPLFCHFWRSCRILFRLSYSSAPVHSCTAPALPPLPSGSALMRMCSCVLSLHLHRELNIRRILDFGKDPDNLQKHLNIAKNGGSILKEIYNWGMYISRDRGTNRQGCSWQGSFWEYFQRTIRHCREPF